MQRQKQVPRFHPNRQRTPVGDPGCARNDRKKGKSKSNDRSRFLPFGKLRAGMTERRAKAKATTEAGSCGMTTRKATGNGDV
jgi:hypothetical protein